MQYLCKPKKEIRKKKIQTKPRLQMESIKFKSNKLINNKWEMGY